MTVGSKLLGQFHLGLRFFERRQSSTLYRKCRYRRIEKSYHGCRLQDSRRLKVGDDCNIRMHEVETSKEVKGTSEVNTSWKTQYCLRRSTEVLWTSGMTIGWEQVWGARVEIRRKSSTSFVREISWAACSVG